MFEEVRKLRSATTSGLYPVFLDGVGGEYLVSNRYRMGGLADTFYEYLLKVCAVSVCVCLCVTRVRECDSEYQLVLCSARVWTSMCSY